MIQPSQCSWRRKCHVSPPSNKERKEGQVLFAIELMICRFEGRDFAAALQAGVPKQMN